MSSTKIEIKIKKENTEKRVSINSDFVITAYAGHKERAKLINAQQIFVGRATRLKNEISIKNDQHTQQKENEKKAKYQLRDEGKYEKQK